MTINKGEKMKIYIIKFNECNYDEYDAFVVVAKDRKDVVSLIKSKYPDYVDWNNSYKITEVVPKKRRKIILESFNAG